MTKATGSWLYIDRRDKVQGPYSTAVMREWYKEKFLPDNLKIKAFEGETEVENISRDVFVELKSMKDCPIVISSEEFAKIGVKRKLEKSADDGFAVPVKQAKKERITPIVPAKVKVRQPSQEDAAGADDKESHRWLYLDRRSKVQGPYSNSIMRKWYSQNHLPLTLPIKEFEGETDLESIPRDLFIELKSYKKCSFVKPKADSGLMAKQKLASVKKKKKVATQWFYKDLEGNEHGPYSLQQMRKWWSKSCFPDDTPVRGSEDKIFVPIVQRLHFLRLLGFERQARDSAAGQTKWFYLDDDGLIRGPYAWKVLKAWHDKEWIPYDVQVKRQGEKHFIPWGERYQNFNLEKMEATRGMNLEESDIFGRTRPKENEEAWYYIDLTGGQIQGPFGTEAMTGWFQAGFFPPITKVRMGTEKPFISIKDWNPAPKFAIVEKPLPQQIVPGPILQQRMPAVGGPVLGQMNMGPVEGAISNPLVATAPAQTPARDPTKLNWFYLGDDGKTIGPFPLAQMRAWYIASYFSDKVHVRSDDMKEFVPIAECPVFKPNPQ